MAKVSILIAEDNPDLRTMLGWLLENEGFEVTMAEDGAKAFWFITHQPPDVILTDLMMPYVDGLELIRWVRGRAELADIPIVAMTAYGDNFLSEANEVGANAALRKPDDLDHVVETINEVLTSHLHPNAA